jgi:protein-L-isoaspartate(D-aspartate) O-methyltransferase
MAWRCSGASNEELLANMRAAGLVTSKRIAHAMTKVDRRCYVPVRAAKEAYTDSPQSIGYGATISAPHMHAYAAEALSSYLEKGSRVLDVGSGSGYTMAVFWHLVKHDDSRAEREGLVVGIDHITELVEMAQQNLKKDGLGSALERRSIEVIKGDGRQGYQARGPYSAIHVGAASTGIPDALIEQLDRPGRMFIPVQDPSSPGQQ